MPSLPFPFMGPIFWVELIFSLIVVITCGLIYFQAKKLYDISSYKGIKYFGNAFLFFGIAFLSRFVLRIFVITVFGLRNPFGFLLFNFGYLIFLYAGLMAGFYLIYSSLWKHLKNPEQIGWLFHPIAVTIASVFIIFLFGSATLLLLLLLFFFAVLLAYSSEKHIDKRDKKGIGKLYILIYFFSLLLLLMLPRNF